MRFCWVESVVRAFLEIRARAAMIVEIERGREKEPASMEGEKLKMEERTRGDRGFLNGLDQNSPYLIWAKFGIGPKEIG